MNVDKTNDHGVDALLIDGFRSFVVFFLECPVRAARFGPRWGISAGLKDSLGYSRCFGSKMPVQKKITRHISWRSLPQFGCKTKHYWVILGVTTSFVDPQAFLWLHHGPIFRITGKSEQSDLSAFLKEIEEPYFSCGKSFFCWVEPSIAKALRI